MPIDVTQLLQWVGISTATKRNIIIADFMPAPEGLSLMRDVGESDLKDANALYARRDNNPFTLGRIHLKRLYALALWVKDCLRVEDEVEFPDGTDREDFLESIQDAYERDERRKELRKVGEALIGKSFQIQLKTQSQWKRWSTELNSVLNSIVGVNGVPIRYVIRHRRHAHPDDTYGSWEERAVALAPLRGPDFLQDSRTVHQIILANIHEDSDAYTYVKPGLDMENGRRDIQGLRERYESHASQQTLINQAKGVLKTLRYKHPRAMKFETFSAKLQRALDDLEECGRPEDNGNIVDDLWDRIQDPNLQAFKAALKVQYSMNPRSYRLILNDLAAEVANQGKATFGGTANISSVTTTGTTSEGSQPQDGAVTADGKLYIGNYTSAAWKSQSVQPYHDQIRDARKANPGWKGKGKGKDRPHSRKQYRKVQSVKKKQKQLEGLKAKVAALEGATEIEELKAKIASMESKDDGKSNDSKSKANAGVSFGGKSTMGSQS